MVKKGRVCSIEQDGVSRGETDLGTSKGHTIELLGCCADGGIRVKMKMADSDTVGEDYDAKLIY